MIVPEAAFAFYLIAQTAMAASPDGSWEIAGVSSTYVSIQSSDGDIRNVIRVTGQNFELRAVGPDQNVGSGSHEGGLISIEENDAYFKLKNIGIVIPRRTGSFNFDGLVCRSVSVSPDLTSVTCDIADKRRGHSYLISRNAGVIAFSGRCYLNTERICDYVLTSKRGIYLKPHGR